MKKRIEIFRSEHWPEIESLRDTLLTAGIEVFVYEITSGVSTQVRDRRALYADWSLRADPDEAERAFRYLSMAEHTEPDAIEPEEEKPVIRRRPLFRFVALLIAFVFGVASLWYAFY